MFCQPESLSDSACFILHAVRQSAVVISTGPKQFHEVAHVLGSRDEQDILQPGPGQFFQWVIHHRPRTHREKVFIGHLGQFAHAGSLPARQDNAANGHENSSW
jgi:hypothetical protein